MDQAAQDNSIVVVVLGPAVLLALAGALVYWIKYRAAGKTGKGRKDDRDN